MFIVAFGSTIAMNIASEKASRVMEVMIPKVKPLTMMYAKILAVVSTALLQLIILACRLFSSLFIRVDRFRKWFIIWRN